MNTHSLKFNITVGGILAAAGLLVIGLFMANFHFVRAAGFAAAFTVIALWGVRLYEIIKY